MIKTSILFLCTGNSRRKQMAEAFVRAFAGDQFDVVSGGSEETPQGPAYAAGNLRIHSNLVGGGSQFEPAASFLRGTAIKAMVCVSSSRILGAVLNSVYRRFQFIRSGFDFRPHGSVLHADHQTADCIQRRARLVLGRFRMRWIDIRIDCSGFQQSERQVGIHPKKVY